jgi:hypothetical protein
MNENECVMMGGNQCCACEGVGGGGVCRVGRDWLDEEIGLKGLF